MDAFSYGFGFGLAFDASYADIEDHLTNEHEAEARRKGAKIKGTPYLSTIPRSKTTMGSQTDKGWLESSINHRNLSVNHKWE